VREKTGRKIPFEICSRLVFFLSCRLLRVLLSHELVRRASEAYTWRDNFSKETLAILAQHAIQARMTRVDTALTRLLVYCQVGRDI
jgi:hypothetical protein